MEEYLKQIMQETLEFHNAIVSACQEAIVNGYAGGYVASDDLVAKFTIRGEEADVEFMTREKFDMEMAMRTINSICLN